MAAARSDLFATDYECLVKAEVIASRLIVHYRISKPLRDGPLDIRERGGGGGGVKQCQNQKFPGHFTLCLDKS